MKFVLLSFFYTFRDDLTENLGKATGQECKMSILPVELRRSKTPLLKVPDISSQIILLLNSAVDSR